jgi:catechol 2,3-dioxygenase-like lactoylglutathione lyase family enzyme
MSLTLLLYCKSLAATREFYREALGFEVSVSPGNTLTATLHGSSLIFTESDLWKSPGPGAFTVYITVTDIARYFEAVKGNLEVEWPLQEMSHGSREFGVKDCNGYRLAFQAPAPHIMRRVNKSLIVEDSNLANSRFSDVNLENASFQDVNLRNSRFLDVNLSGANFTDVDLSGASIVDCRVKCLTIDGVLVSELIRAYEA